MKKFLTYSSIPLLLITGYLLITVKSLNEKIAAFEEKNNAPGTACYSCTNYDSVQPLQKLNAVMLQEMANMYYRNMSSSTLPFSGPFNNTDARSIWFDLDSVKHFIWEVENMVCKNKCSENKANTMAGLGLRIYYSRYPQTNASSRFTQLGGLPANYTNRHTLFMVPTYDSIPGEHIDFDPYKFDAGRCGYLPLQTGTEAAPVFITALAGVMSKPPGANSQEALNHGGLCPPICKPGNGAVFTP